MEHTHIRTVFFVSKENGKKVLKMVRIFNYQESLPYSIFSISKPKRDFCQRKTGLGL